MEKLEFPADFLWGAATSAFQTEGNNVNSDWWKWERSPKRIKELRDRNKNPEDYFSNTACDSYNRYEEDFDLAAEMKLNAFRFSIEWAKVEPKEGEFDPEVIEHYRKVLLALRDRGMKTFVTFHHFTNPQWFAEKGAWEKRANVKYFVRYAEKLADEFGGLMDYVCVINEINFETFSGYIKGSWVPQKRSLWTGWKVFGNLILAHKETYKLLKDKGVLAPVCSCAASSTIISKNILIKAVIPLLHLIFYRYLLMKLNKYSDAIAVNYYTVLRLKMVAKPPFFKMFKEGAVSDYGWEIYPKGLFMTLDYCKRFRKPIYITENGIADSADKQRTEFIRDHLIQVHKSISNGVPVKGYFHWSFIDNMELDQGYSMKFGLVEIDRNNNLQRKPRPSSRYYAEICKNNYLEI